MFGLLVARYRTKRGGLLPKTLVLLVAVTALLAGGPAGAATSPSAAAKPAGFNSSGHGDECAPRFAEGPDGEDVPLPGANPEACPLPLPVDCETFAAGESNDPDDTSRMRQVSEACEEYPEADITVCSDDQFPSITLPNATVVTGNPAQINVLLEYLESEADLKGLLEQFFDPDDPDFYSADPDLGYAVVPFDQRELQIVIDGLGLDEITLSPVHVYQGHKMSRGHPVDEYTELGPSGAPGTKPDYAAPTVVVVDAGGTPGDGGVKGHGAFASRVVSEYGVPVTQADFDVKVATFFDDTDIVPAILAEFFHNDPTAPSQYDADTVVNMSFGTYNCGLATQWLTEVLHRLTDNGHVVVASAGNDEANELTFPAALSFDWEGAYGTKVFTEGGAEVSGVLPHDAVYSVGSVDNRGKRSCFSNWGVWVESWYPGEEVYAETPGRSLFGWGGTWSGTSFAAPQLAGDLAAGNGLTGAPEPANLTVKYNYPLLDVASYCSPKSPYKPVDTIGSP